MDSILPTLDVEQALAMLNGTMAELRDTQERLKTSQEQLEEMNMLLFEQSATDALTGLKNRTAFDRIMKQQASRNGRSKASLALLLVDVDNCKAFNTEFGRAGGDDVLQQIAQVLKAQARAYDYVVRYEDDAFAVVLPDTPRDGAKVVAQRIRATVEALPLRRKSVTVSIGVAVAQTPDENTTQIARLAAALDKARAAGGNQVYVDGLDFF